MAFELSFALTNAADEIAVTEAYVASDRADEGGAITVVQRSANSAAFHVQDLPDYRLFLFLAARYPGWSAVLDGRPVPILDANDAFMAVEVPPGSHDIRFVFTSKRVYASLALSLTTWAAAGAGILFAPRICGARRRPVQAGRSQRVGLPGGRGGKAPF